jgi:hypothetical protein
MIQQIVTEDGQIKVIHGQIAHKNFLCVNELLHCFWEFTIGCFSAITMNNIGLRIFKIATRLGY